MKRVSRRSSFGLTDRPIVTSPANLGINNLLRRIEAERGDLPKLRAFVGTFRGSLGTPKELAKASTYYRLAGRYLWGLIHEAEGEAKSEVKPSGSGGAGGAMAATHAQTDQFDMSGVFGLVQQLQVTGCSGSDLRALIQLIAEMKPQTADVAFLNPARRHRSEYGNRNSSSYSYYETLTDTV